MSEVLVDLATAGAGGVEFVFEGRTYTYAPPTLGVFADMEVWARKAAFEEADSLGYDAGELAAAKAEIRREVRDGKYGLGGPKFAQYASTAKGTAELFRRCIRLRHPELTDADTDKIARGISPAVMARIKDIIDPNPTPPTTMPPPPGGTEAAG